MYSNIYCPESQRGHQPLQSRGFWEEGMLRMEIEEYYVRFVLRRSEDRMYLNLFCPESQRGDRPLQSCVFFRPRNTYVARKLKKIGYVLFSGEMKTECIRICCPDSQRSDQPLQSCVFFERKEHFTRKLKKIAYVSFSGKMKTECVRIYIVVVTKTDYAWLFTTWIDIWSYKLVF